MNKTLSLFVLLIPLFLFNNCSDVSFNDSPSQDDGSFAAETNTTEPSTPAATTAPPVSGAPQIVPKVQFVGPPCPRLSLCQAEFRLDKAYSLPTEFNWRTNDTLHLTPNNPVYAQPGVHYNSTSGVVNFAPGETSKKIYIQNINSYTLEVIIGVIMSQCKYGTYNGSCTSFFQ
jgi:hypothetical protein